MSESGPQSSQWQGLVEPPVFQVALPATKESKQKLVWRALLLLCTGCSRAGHFFTGRESTGDTRDDRRMPGQVQHDYTVQNSEYLQAQTAHLQPRRWWCPTMTLLRRTRAYKSETTLDFFTPLHHSPRSSFSHSPASSASPDNRAPADFACQIGLQTGLAL